MMRRGGGGGGRKERGGELRKDPAEGLRVEPESVLAVLFCNCVALTAAPAINTMGERKRELLVRDHLLTEIIFSLALG